MPNPQAPKRRRHLRVAPLSISAGIVASMVLGLSATGTLSSFTASITNDTNTAASGSLVMQETDTSGNTICLSSTASNNANTSCSTINKYGGTANGLTPGGTPNVTTVRLYNTGTSSVSGFTLAPGTCRNTGTTSGNLCSQMTLSLTCAPVSGGTAGSTVTIYNKAALSTLTSADIATASSTCVPPRSSSDYVQFVFSVQLSSGADNTVQAQTVSQPLVWTYTGA